MPFGFCQTQSSDSSPSPLDEHTKRQIHAQLDKLQGLLLTTMPDLEKQVVDLKTLIEEEQANRAKLLSAEQQATKAAQIERDTCRQQLEFYQNAAKVKKQGKGFWCGLWKFLTIGISGCR